MKHAKLTLLAMTVALTACSEKDEAYYLSHPDEAKEKMAQCEKEINTAMKNRDEKTFNSIMAKGSECFVADRALKEIRRIEREKEKQERKAKEEAELKTAMEKLEQQYRNQSWQEFATIFANSECSKGSFVNKECKPMKAFYDTKIEKGLTELKALGVEKLLSEFDTYCKRDQRRYSTCDVWKLALEQQGKVEFAAIDFPTLSTKEEIYCDSKYNQNFFAREGACKAWHETVNAKEEVIINEFVQNYDKLKQTYNQCIDTISAEKSWEKRNKLESAYPCKQARKARIKLQLPYDDFKTKME